MRAFLNTKLLTITIETIHIEAIIEVLISTLTLKVKWSRTICKTETIAIIETTWVDIRRIKDLSNDLRVIITPFMITIIIMKRELRQESVIKGCIGKVHQKFVLRQITFNTKD